MTDLPITTLQQARSELSELYRLAKTNALSSAQIADRLKPLQVLVASLDRSAPLQINASINEDIGSTGAVSSCIVNIEEKIRSTGATIEHLKKEWKVLAGQSLLWTNEDEEKLQSRITRGVLIKVKAAEKAKSAKNPPPEPTNLLPKGTP